VAAGYTARLRSIVPRVEAVVFSFADFADFSPRHRSLMPRCNNIDEIDPRGHGSMLDGRTRSVALLASVSRHRHCADVKTIAISEFRGGPACGGHGMMD
jgi:hypothetical protein